MSLFHVRHEPESAIATTYAMFDLAPGIFRDADGNVYQFISGSTVKRVATVEPLKYSFPDNFTDPFYYNYHMAPFQAVIGAVEVDCELGENLPVSPGYRTILIQKRHGQLP